MNNRIEIFKQYERLPFYGGVRQTPYRGGDIPDFLPFAMGLRRDIGLVVQKPESVVQRALALSYEHEDLYLTVPMDESELTRWRGEEFLAVLAGEARIDPAGCDLLEIGCQTGFILSQMRDRGARVRGCEPGPSAEVARERYGLEVDRCFFEPGRYRGRADIVTHLAVLEHVDDPVAFLAETAAALRPGGVTLIGVPDCEGQLRLGDPGMLLHEHCSYFTPTSLERTLVAAGFSDVGSYSSGVVVYGWGRWTGRAGPSEGGEGDGAGDGVRAYIEKLDGAVSGVGEWLQAARGDGERAGFYGASVGAANLLALLYHNDVDLKLYDGDPAKQGAYLSGCPIQIRNPEELLNDAPDRLLILPVNYTDPIERFLREDLKLPISVHVDALSRMLGTG
ncbi:MAG: class I SAM-dependent methyltransferase [Candidatus Latescibacterota bacterium]|nr:class I SAM-dependent methyltransferase [Candidatus Latescibacterota bacterium]